MNWLLTVILTIVAYSLYSYFGLRVAGSETALRAGLAPLTSWINFGIVMLGTIAFSLALFFGAKASAFAVTVVIALGVVVSFAFSIVVGGSSAGVIHGAGIALILVGVALLR